ncbi:MAG: metal ABC transporter permease [Chloroflexi bacterium]|nr:metal ABC transporter permease [Chloroflexota bacterium]
MVRALMAGTVAGLLCPAIGVFLVLRRYSLMADSLAHISLAGVAIGLLLGLYPVATALLVAIGAAVLIEWLRTERHVYGEATLAMFLSGGLALALILLSLGRGLTVDLFSFLFGSIIAVSPADVWTITGLGLLLAGLITLLYKELVYVTFDEESARVGGLPVRALNFLLVVMAAVTVSLAMRVVGVLLVGALMVIPVVSALQVARSFRAVLVTSMGLGVLAVLSGLLAAYYLDLAAGGAIVLAALLIFAATLPLGRSAAR